MTDGNVTSGADRSAVSRRHDGTGDLGIDGRESFQIAFGMTRRQTRNPRRFRLHADAAARQQTPRLIRRREP